MIHFRFSTIAAGLDAVVVAMAELEDSDSSGMEESSIKAQAYNLLKVLRACVKQLQHTLGLKCHHRKFSS